MGGTLRWIGRYERKIRRRDKAAILNPKPDPPAEKKVKPKLAPETEEALPDSWWQEHRLRKRGLAQQPDPDPNFRPDLGLGKVKKDKPTERIGTEVNTRKKDKKGKEKVGKGGIPGLEIIMNYKPSIPLTGVRLTVGYSRTSTTPPLDWWLRTDGIDETSIKGIVWEWSVIRSGPLTIYNRPSTQSVPLISHDVPGIVR